MAKIGINIKEGKVDQKNHDIIIGIDLGTTNSLVAVIKDGNPVCLKDPQGKSSLVPSIIHFAEDDTIIIGEKAKQALIDHPERTLFSVKRLMGKSHQDLKDWKGVLDYKIIEEDDEEKLVKIKVGNRFYTPIELSAIILRGLKGRAEKLLGQEVSKAVITVPAYFNDTQRQATRDAGKLAGLEVLRIVNEPTAASLAYGMGLDPAESKNIAVYDLGGGTFDVSILHLEGGIFEVLSTHGDTFLGGDDIDHAIVKHWLETYTSLENQGKKLRLLAEEAKKALSTSDTFQTSFEGTELSLDLASFNQLIAPLIAKTIASCGKALKDAKLSTSDINQVVLVGGSTRTPAVRIAVAEFFQQDIVSDLDPDEIVALGAAVQADILAGNRKDLLLLDVTPLSLGIETVGELMDIIIPRNSSIPIKAGRNYTTSVDGQKNLKVSVYQGERDIVADNRKLGEFILSNIPPMAAGLPKIEIQFLIDANGILRVKAKELRSGVEQQVTIKSQFGISADEMGQMLKDSIINAKDDMEIRALTEARTEGEHVLYSLVKFIDQNQDYLTTNQMVVIKKMGDELRESVDTGNKDRINLAMETLNNYTRPLAEEALDRAVSGAMKGKNV